MGFAIIDASLPDVDELVETSGIIVPAVRLFRRGLMFDFNLDPLDTVSHMLSSTHLRFRDCSRGNPASLSRIITLTYHHLPVREHGLSGDERGSARCNCCNIY